MAEIEAVRLQVLVEGRVQGVGYRNFVSDNATRLGLTGWVRNRWDGNVEVLAEGERQLLEKLLDKLKRGPQSSFVLKVTPEWQDATGEFSRFSVHSNL
jgi:acylphosphatase